MVLKKIFFLYRRTVLPAALLCLSCSLIYGRELPLPEVPDSLRTPSERAAYVVNHFWDAMDFTDSAALADTMFIEGSFATFASVMPHAPAEVSLAAVERLMNRIDAAGLSSSWLDMAESYLYEPDSPVYCEDCFSYFLRHALASGYADMRRQAQLEEVTELAPGSVAPTLVTLPSVVVASPECPTLIFFYDSQCSDCQRMIAALGGDAQLTRAVDDGLIRVVSVELSGAASSVLPGSWLTTIAADPDEVYMQWHLGRMPSLWVIGSDGKIVLRNTSPAAVRQLIK